MTNVMMFGAALFFAGALTAFLLLVSNGGAQRSRQFAVLGQLFSGALGSGKRVALIIACALIATGAMTCFAGVAAMDAARAARCHEYCVALDYTKGTIGPSVDRSPATRFVACTCTSRDRPDVEQRADRIPQ